MKRALSICLLLVLGTLASAAPGKLRPEIMGIALGMNRDDAHAHLKSLGSLEKDERKLQEVWALRDARISHLLVGYDDEFRVRYVTAIAREGGPRIRYQEVANLKSAQRIENQGNLRLTWEVPGRGKQLGYVIIARGRNPQYLDSYSVKRLSDKEID
ncbi:MAG TPA: hypothetical protein VJ875_01495 [Pyrinomonadaceae bacterium]|nr:hypothetical protein [Pyrinomonadaceae bacterium]